MKVLLLPAYFTPEVMSSTMLDQHRYEAFANAGFIMELYTPIPTRGITNDIRDEYKNIRFELMYDGFMSVHRFSLFKEGKNPIGRAVRYFLAFIIQFYKGVRAKDIDCIYLVSTPPIQGMLGAFLKKIIQVPFVYNLQDIFPDSLVGSGLSKEGSLLYKIGRIIEDFTYKNADKIIVISQDFKNNIMAKGVPESKIEVIYNWVDEKSIFPVEDDDNPLFDEFCISRDNFRVVYAGNLGNAQNINIIIDAAIKMRDCDGIEFLIFGSGGLEEQIREKIDKDGLTNIRLFPLQSLDRAKYVYSLGNACIVSCKSGLGGSAMPSKTWSILSCGRPVIASFDEGELKTILERNGCGIFSKADDVDGFVEAINNLRNNPSLCQEMGINGRQFILDNLTKEKNTKRYVNIIKDLTN